MKGITRKDKEYFMTNNEKGQNSMDHHCRVNKPEGGRKNLRCIPRLLLIIKKFPKYFRVYLYIFSKNNKSLCSSLFLALLSFSPDCTFLFESSKVLKTDYHNFFFSYTFLILTIIKVELIPVGK